ncbi:uncharacterized protein LOC110978022 [Acanthaster planci]|uniref:Uncharacterized protein LOC110978022 n=1 Tax=Acanthaster planci TaxID=133434 RepID=A0A8B7Y7M2_ACAPL|nr:uncharacterized protein LOC110978022 [Acanthaster planci]
MVTIKRMLSFAAILGSVLRGRSFEVSISRTSPHAIDGRVTSYECRITAHNSSRFDRYWTLDGRQFGALSSNSSSDTLHVTLHRNMSGSTLMCYVYTDMGVKNAKWTIDVMYPSNHVSLDMNSTKYCDSDMDCSADVTIGRHYRFTCNASGSNPASTILWLISTKGHRGVCLTEIPSDWSQSGQDENADWDTSSQINLQILPEDRHSSIVCRVMFPSNKTLFTEIAVKLQVRNEPGSLKELLMTVCIPTAGVIGLACVAIAIARKRRQKYKPRQPHPQADSSRPPSSQHEESQASKEKGVYQEIPAVREYQTRVSIDDHKETTFLR